MGIILGTGSNACYVEYAKNAEFFNKTEPLEKDEKVVINCEWGAFGDFGSLEFIRTSFDREIDFHSLNPNNQLFEKMLSGMYLGELVRLVLVKLATYGYIFNGKLSQKLCTKNEFLTKYISAIESETPEKFDKVRKELKKLDIDDPSDQDCINVRYVCECVSKRSAYLVSAAIASLIIRMGDSDITVGVDGSVYRYHPKFHDLMMKKIQELIPENYKFRLVLSEDGSGRGAALVAAVASRNASQ
jgi:hexokinase